MKLELLSSDVEHEFSVDRVVTTATYDLVEKLGRGSIATLVSGCRNGAIASMLDAKPELAAVFIRLGAELIATADDEVVIEKAIILKTAVTRFHPHDA